MIWHLIGSASRITTALPMQQVMYPDIPGTRPFEPVAADIYTTSFVTLFHVEPQAERDVIQLLEPAAGNFALFKIPALRHVTTSIGQ
ncbi:MAG: hypothetical protein H0T42_12295 [Deltaproteobacteria bacterium]|nr:hypothetical protein [Deltaproteobacteria bacterium]